MLKKKSVKGIHALYICLSHEWSTIERRCLNDAEFINKQEARSFILCSRNSFLALEAEKKNIRCLFLENDNLDFNHIKDQFILYVSLKTILKKNNIDLIHVFDHRVLLTVSLLAKAFTRIPLFYTFNKYVAENNLSFFTKWVYSRIDHAFCLTYFAQFMASEILGTPWRKVEQVGSGIITPEHESFCKNMKKELFTQKSSYQSFNILTFVSQAEHDVEKLKLILDSFDLLRLKLVDNDLKNSVKLTVITEDSWEQHPIFAELKRVVLERHLEFKVHFKTYQSFFDLMSSQACSIVVGLESQEMISDRELVSLLGGSPLLLPRTLGRSEILLQDQLGATYHPSDKRDLSDKLLAMIENFSFYELNLENHMNKLLELHSSGHYFKKNHQFYIRRFTQRIRYSQKKKLL